MVIRIAGLAYQKGFGGHFHNDNSFAVLRDVPGVIVACPSNGADAAMMLRECMRLAAEEQRVVVFLEPIALYMTKDLHAVGDQQWLCEYPDVNQIIPVGELGFYGESDHFVILTYGNGYYLSRQAEKILRENHDIKVKIVDLRWLVPLNVSAILAAVKDYRHVLIVDECRRTGSLSEELVTLLYEQLRPIPNIARITAEDCFIPLGNAWQYLLPSTDAIVDQCIKMNKV
jgi:2-oxoisovalerate dehydrogenase E1 component